MVLFEKILPTPHAVIAAVGGGGKTTCLKALAADRFCRERTVLLTTTTHMRRENAVTDLSDPDKLIWLLNREGLLFAGSPAQDDKIGPLPQALYRQLASQADLVLVEADGAKMLPMKYPAPWEPVYPEETDHVLILFGLSALGKELSRVCHRWELAAERFGWSGSTIVTAEVAFRVLEAGYLQPLRAKGIPHTLLLNQRDLAGPEEANALSALLSHTPHQICSLL